MTSMADRDETREFAVVVNDEEQYSIWASGRELPAGWRAVGVTGDKRRCLAHIDEVWQDMRPRSVRERMAQPPRIETATHSGEATLVSRLAAGTWPVEVRPAGIDALRDAIRRGYVRIFFPDTAGGTELTVPIDRATSDLSEVDSAAPGGVVRIAGQLSLDFQRISCEVVVDVSSMTARATVAVPGLAG